MFVGLDESVLVVNHDAVVIALTEAEHHHDRLGALAQPSRVVEVLLRARQALRHVLGLHRRAAQDDFHARFEEEDAEVVAQRASVLGNVLADGSDVLLVDFLALRIQNVVGVGREVQLEAVVVSVKRNMRGVMNQYIDTCEVGSRTS